MLNFSYTSYEKILTDIRSFFRGAEFNNTQFLDYVKVLNNFIDLCPLYEKVWR